jgi:hypothetical protein
MHVPATVIGTHHEADLGHTPCRPLRVHTHKRRKRRALGPLLRPLGCLTTAACFLAVPSCNPARVADLNNRVSRVGVLVDARIRERKSACVCAFVCNDMMCNHHNSRCSCGKRRVFARLRVCYGVFVARRTGR